MKLNCNVLVDGLGWFTLMTDTMDIDCSSSIEIGGRLLEMISGVKRVEFVKKGEEWHKPISITRCPRCNLPNFVDPNYVHGEHGDPLTRHCTFCTEELVYEIPNRNEVEK